MRLFCIFHDYETFYDMLHAVCLCAPRTTRFFTPCRRTSFNPPPLLVLLQRAYDSLFHLGIWLIARISIDLKMTLMREICGEKTYCTLWAKVRKHAKKTQHAKRMRGKSHGVDYHCGDHHVPPLSADLSEISVEIHACHVYRFKTHVPVLAVAALCCSFFWGVVVCFVLYTCE